MMKRIVAMALCLVCLLLCIAGCSHGENDQGAYIRMYLSEPVYDVDPLNAFDNQAALQIVSLIYEGLFTADDNGKPKKALVDDYEYVVDKDEGTYKLVMDFKETHWSDGVALTAYDAQYSFERLFKENHPASAMLYDIKNARAIAIGEESIGHLGVVAVDPDTLEIEFEGDIDIDTFLPVLCSPALYPLRSDNIDKNPNTWNKVDEDIVCSGPFVVNSMDFTTKDGFVLDRNGYYYRDRTKDDADKYVNPYRIIVDYSTPAADQIKNFNTGEVGSLYYLGYIPLAARTDENAELLKKLEQTDASSTHVYYMNQAVAPFDKAEVRNALSLALDREAMVKAIVYAEAATALVPNSIRYRADKKTTFRDKAETYLSSTASVTEAQELLEEAGIKASDYSFTLTVNTESEEHVAMAEIAVAAWKALGFNVTLEKLGLEMVMTTDDEGNEVFSGAYNSLYRAALQSGDFDVIALDLVATAPTALSYLAPFATEFSGNGYTSSYDVATGVTTYAPAPHITGYNSEEYNEKIDAAQSEKNEKKRAQLLVEAEAILMEDMPVIPVIYNKDVAVSAKGLKRVSRTFFCANFLTEAKLSGYWKIALAEGWVTEEE